VIVVKKELIMEGGRTDGEHEGFFTLIKSKGLQELFSATPPKHVCTVYDALFYIAREIRFILPLLTAIAGVERCCPAVL